VARFLDNIAATVTVQGGTGTNTLTINDQNDGFSDTYTLTGSSVTRTFSSLISYSGQHTLNLNGGSGNDTVNVLGTAAGVTTNFLGNGLTTVNVGNAGSVRGILGTLNLENTLSNGTTLIVNASADPFTVAPAVTFTPPGDTPWESLTGLAPAAINWEWADTGGGAILDGPTTTIIP
jgi:hypothetical protein